MAHQFVDEILHAHDEVAHGETFRRVCAERGIDARAAGAPTVGAGHTPEADRVLERIRKLLALAGSSNPARGRGRDAQGARADAAPQHRGRRGARAYEVRHLGDPTRRGNRVEDDIVGLLSEFFFVKPIRIPVYLPRLGRRGAVFEIAGSRANVEMAEHVYGFLLATADRLWLANRTDERVRSGRDRHARISPASCAASARSA